MEEVAKKKARAKAKTVARANKAGTRVHNYEATDAVAMDTYVHAVMEGRTHSEAYRLSHPNTKAKGNPLTVLAWRFHNRPDVQQRIQMERTEAQEHWSWFRDELVGMLTQEIRTCYQDNQTLSPVMKQVESVMKILGLDKQVIDVKADVRHAMDVESATEKINFLILRAGGGQK